MTPEVAAYIATVKSSYQLWMSNLALKERMGIGKNRLMLYIQVCFITGYMKIIDRYYSKTDPDIDNFITKTLMDILRGRVDRILKVPVTPAITYYGPLTFNYTGAQCILKFKVLTGETLTIDWGNGNISVINGIGDNLIISTSTYTSIGIYPIKFTCSKTAVTYFDINDQSLSGDISWVLRWVSLSYLDLFNNSGLTGDLSNLGTLTTLQHIDLYGTTLTTCVVTSWSSLINLEFLDLRGSNATGVVTSWSALVNLREVYLSGTAVTGSIAGWTTMTDLTIAWLITTGLTGSITGWSVLTNIEELKLNNNVNITGSITGFSALTKLRILDLYGMSVLTGDITNFLHCIEMVYMDMTGCTSVVGNIAGFFFMTNLEYLYLYGTLVSGDVSAYYQLTRLLELRLTDTTVNPTLMAWYDWNNITLLHLGNTGTTGDVNYLADCDDLQTIILSDTTVSYGDLGSYVWNKIGMYFDCTSCGWTSTEVNDCLIDLAVTPCQNCVIHIGGTNAVRTAASDAAKATLLANGCTIIVNE